VSATADTVQIGDHQLSFLLPALLCEAHAVVFISVIGVIFFALHWRHDALMGMIFGMD